MNESDIAFYQVSCMNFQVLDETLGGPIAWSRSEQRLAYVARKIHRDPTPYHLEQDWGEKLQGIQDTWIILVSWTHQVGSIKVTPLVQVPSLVGQVHPSINLSRVDIH